MKESVDGDLEIAKSGTFLMIDDEPDKIRRNGRDQKIQRVK